MISANEMNVAPIECFDVHTESPLLVNFEQVIDASIEAALEKLALTQLYHSQHVLYPSQL